MSETRALHRGLDILTLVARAGAPLTLSEVARGVDLSPATVHRMLSTLTERSYLVRGDDKAYRLGPRSARLAAATTSRDHLTDLATPHLSALRDATAETVNLGVLDGGVVQYLLGLQGLGLLQVASSPGLRLPAHCTALGKCLLAHMDTERAHQLVGDGPYERRTRNTLVDWHHLEQDLARTRKRGHARSREEFEIGLCSVAAPVRDGTGSVVAAVNVAAPATRSSQLTETALPLLIESTSSISRALGHEL